MCMIYAYFVYYIYIFLCQDKLSDAAAKKKTIYIYVNIYILLCMYVHCIVAIYRCILCMYIVWLVSIDVAKP